MAIVEHEDSALKIGGKTLASRLIVGTGRYHSLESMQQSLELSGADCVTVAVRRERLYDPSGQNILDFIDTDRFLLLPNTASCYTVEDALRTARLGREILRGLENDGANWVKLEVLGDARTLLPDVQGTLRATEKLVGEGFQVLCYTSDDPVVARQLKELGAAAVMPAGSPIGSGTGNPQSQQHSDLFGIPQGGRSRLPGDRGRRRRHGERRRAGDGVGGRRCTPQYGHRPCA